MDPKQFRAVEEALYSLRAEVSGFGIEAMGMHGGTLNGKPGLECMLYANELLTEQILEAPEGTYWDTLPLMYRKIFDGMMPYQQYGAVLCRSEALALGLSNDVIHRMAGVRYQEDHYHVPPSNYLSLGKNVHATDAELLAQLDPWGHVISDARLFNAEVLEHKMFISLSVLPWDNAAHMSERTFRRSVLITQFGWNMFAGEQDPALGPHVATLKNAATQAEARRSFRVV